MSLPLEFITGTGWDNVNNLSIEANVSADASEWPFEINSNNYRKSLTLSHREATAAYNFTISQKAAAGVYALKFTITYKASNDSVTQRSRIP